MSRYVKVAVSLPEDVFDAAESERETLGTSRSEFVALAIREYLRHEREREWARQDAEAYRRIPETADELAMASAMSRSGWAENPWEADAD
ncbi:MAG: ribbon-helix-helix protein, CopG family [Dehalococcoidia bacterium]|nr:ribbon-helix-helix protein, CopG family [Dehalococcoidia bacterium]